MFKYANINSSYKDHIKLQAEVLTEPTNFNFTDPLDRLQTHWIELIHSTELTM